jgi:peptidoglycan-associated lipoprotein
MLVGAARAGAVDDAEMASSSDDESAVEPACDEAGVTVTFSSGSTAIGARGRASLDGMKKWLDAEEGRSVRIEGYADKTGNPEKNLELSENRADAAKDYLVSRGVEGDRIETTAHGDQSDRADIENTRAVVVLACASPEATMPAETPTETAEPVAPPPEPEAADEEAAPIEPLPSDTYTAVDTVPPPTSDLPQSVIGVQATVGGGVTGFIQDGARAFSGTGGSWDARLAFGTRQWVGLEAAYVGSAQGINILGLDNDAVLVGNGAEAALRVNFTRARVQPYLFGGVGWMNYSITNTAVTASMDQMDNVFALPFGAGVSARLGRGFILDVRGTGRATFDDTLLEQSAFGNQGNAELHSWNATGRLGWEF